MIFLKKIIFFLWSISVLMACRSLPDVPKGMIGVEKMTDILAEIHLAEAKLNKVTFQNYDSTKVAFRELERRIYAKYQVDSATYRKSYDFYATEPELMLEVYKNINQKLDDFQKEAQNKASTNKVVKEQSGVRTTRPTR